MFEFLFSVAAYAHESWLRVSLGHWQPLSEISLANRRTHCRVWSDWLIRYFRLRLPQRLDTATQFPWLAHVAELSSLALSMGVIARSRRLSRIVTGPDNAALLACVGEQRWHAVLDKHPREPQWANLAPEMEWQLLRQGNGLHDWLHDFGAGLLLQVLRYEEHAWTGRFELIRPYRRARTMARWIPESKMTALLTLLESALMLQQGMSAQQ